MHDIRVIFRRFVAAMLLMVVAAHAAAPFAQPFERSAGSAFSAATADVSLACGQPAAVAKRTLPADPHVPVLAVPAAPRAQALPGACRSHLTGLGATGPPASKTSFSPLAPRAPPAA